jgi:hypothetical protein
MFLKADIHAKRRTIRRRWAPELPGYRFKILAEAYNCLPLLFYLLFLNFDYSIRRDAVDTAIPNSQRQPCCFTPRRFTRRNSREYRGRGIKSIFK